MTRRHRGLRAKDKPLLLTERDTEILSLIGLCRYVSTEQVAREFFPSEDRARRRVRRLFDAHLIAITMIGSTRCNLISLTSSGRAVLEQSNPDIAKRAQLAGPIRLAGVQHHLAIVDARIYIAATGRAHGTELQRWSSGSDAAARAMSLEAFRLHPDGVAELSFSGGCFRVAVEVDCATEGTPVIASKLERYEQVFSAGIIHELWVVAFGGRRRCESVAQMVRRHRLHGRTRVLTPEHLKEKPTRAPPPVIAEVR